MNATKREGPHAPVKHDCHSCAIRRVKCDRSRPCGTCKQSGNTCGYTLQLSWQRGFSTDRRPVKKSIKRSIAKRNADGQWRFEFISENPVTTSEKSPSSVITALGKSLPVVDDNSEASVQLLAGSKLPREGTTWSIPSSSNEYFQMRQADEDIGLLEPLVPQDEMREILRTSCVKSPAPCFNSGGMFPALEMARGREESPNAPDEIGNGCSSLPSSNQLLVKPNSVYLKTYNRTFKTTFDERSHKLTSSGHLEVSTFPPDPSSGILHSNISTQYKPILELYNRELCTLPLTFNMQINPFQYNPTYHQEFLFLIHAVLALSCHHIQDRSSEQGMYSPRVDDHRRTALQLIRQSLDTHDAVRNNRSAFLDTIIILFSLEETNSVLGNWTTHLKGAYSVLESSGGVEDWSKSQRSIVQVGILVWWDAVTNLISRKDCVFPYAYLEAVISTLDNGQWSFFGLCGCPQSLVVPLIELAHLVAEKQKTATMCSSIFDLTLISQIEESLEDWRHTPSPDALRDEESMQQDQDCMHGSEAWRNGLLIYIYRMFWWKPGMKVPVEVAYRARRTMDHVFACRSDTLVAKQALLPLWWAGCELTDAYSRTKIVDFCLYWSKRSGYHLFKSAVPLLQELWADQERFGSENVWWGQIVDEKQLSLSTQWLEVRVCFG